MAAVVAKAFGYLMVGLRFPIIAAWAAAVIAAVLLLPPLPTSGGLSDLIPAGSPAAQADATAARLFGYPLEAGIAIVQRDPRGLPAAAVNKAARAAQAYDKHPTIPGLVAVIPIPNGRASRLRSPSRPPARPPCSPGSAATPRRSSRSLSSAPTRRCSSR